MTKSELARIAEWAFCKNQLNSEADIVRLGLRIFVSLPGRNDIIGSAQLLRGLTALCSDLKPIVAKLRYGGRSSQNIPLERVQMLQSWIENGQFSHLAA